MKPADFVHLHVHSDFSLLDGACTVNGLVDKAARCKHTALALTDHGNMCGALNFYKAAKSRDVKPIVGCEIYLAPGKMTERVRGYNHLTLLARDLDGYRNLSKLSSLGYRDGFYYKPRVDFDSLREYSQGIVALSGCVKGPVSVPLIQDDFEEARRVTETLKGIYNDDFYLEIQPNDFEAQHKVNDGCIKLNKDMGIPLVATCDVHYLEPGDDEVQDIKICIGSGKVLSASNRLKIKSALHYRGTDEVARFFNHVDGGRPILNTRAIAEKVDFTFPTGTYYLPKFEPPGGLSQEDYFEKLTREGMRERYGDAAERFEERLLMEMGVIKRSGYVAYFLIVADFINWARDQGIPVGPGRGSAAGSIVAYALGITNLDPLKYDLLFERFLNPDRVSMPDIDIDFCEANRGRVIEYVRQKYGEECVTQIVTFGTLKAKAVVRDVGRVMEVPLGEVNRLAKLIPEGPKVNLNSAFETEPELGEARKKNRLYDQLFSYAERLEGLNRHAGKHAAGVVISDVDLLERIPLYRVGKDLTTQYTMAEVEEVGLLKMDFLGLRTLTVIDHAERMISKRLGREFTVSGLPLDDETTYEMMSRGETRGVFQLESSGFRELIVKVKPDRFEDIIALIALYRPGPLGSGMDRLYVDRKHGREAITYEHPSLEPMLKETYGAILYQEQVMRIANKVAGFTMAEADVLRKAMGKKKIKLMEEFKPKFIKGCGEVSEVPEATARTIWDQIAFFAEYGFNKCVVGATELIEARSGERCTVEELISAPREFYVHALGEDQKLRPRKVVDFMRNGCKEVFELRTAQGKRIVATGNHPFRTLDGWTLLAELKIGDRIAAPRALVTESTDSWPTHQLISLAGLISEGNTCHPSCLYFFNNDPLAIEDFAEAIAAFPDTVARITKRPGSRRMEVCASTGRDTRFKPGHTPWNSAKAPATKHPIRSGAYLWADELGIVNKRADEKSVPHAVFGLCDADLELFLGRLWMGDGFIANATQFVPYYATSSEQLARDVQSLLLRLGILSGVHFKTFRYRGQDRPGYTVHLIGEGSREAFLTRLAPHILGRDGSIEQLRAYLAKSHKGVSKDTIPGGVRRWVQSEKARLGLTWKAIEERSGVSMKEFTGRGSHVKKGFRRATICRLASFFKSQALQDLSESDIFWDEIVSIEARGCEETYDLTIEEDHNFVADGLIVHNSHSAAYGLVTYHTAYLKAHYPAEYMAALLTSFRSQIDRMVEYIEECKRLDIEIIAPDVNHGVWEFSVLDGKIVYGLEAVKGVGHGAVEAIVEAREKLGEPFRSIFHFCEEVDIARVSKSVLEQLIKAGAFDGFGAHRAQLVAAIEPAVNLGVKTQKDRNSQQIGLFGGAVEETELKTMDEAMLPDVPEWSQIELLGKEKEALGFYLSSHPLDEQRELLETYSTRNSRSLKAAPDGEVAVIGGMVQTLRTTFDRKGKQMGFLTLEDPYGTVEAVLFGSIFADVRHLLTADARIFLKGKIECRRDEPQMIVDQVTPFEKAPEEYRVRVRFDMSLEDTTKEDIEALRSVIGRHPGSDNLQYTFTNKDGVKIGPFMVGSHLQIRASKVFEEAIRTIIGEERSYTVRASIGR